ncbi:DNA cytosine methyltransferase [Salmonella enterica subsp. enterica serovar Minnesota]|nr:DNA cytosine methyltransferase [Salmonella enterica]ELZ4877172.1 DNA cytosine methyltransferase [Salmonella enterica]ELZ4895149.1 DNA cytosine methyltransferase [Salmonella enterica]
MIPAAYYNEIDPFAAQWLRNLIAGGHIAPGEVDERSIEDVTPDDLRGFTQCHWFAGIAVWSHSLRLAGWPDDKPVWTGSCPCQPFSAAGKGDGFADERHLWPHFFHLISERRPQHVFGEQVAAGNANAWFDLVQADLEGVGYAFGLVPFTSAGIGAPHIRERAYWVAHADSERFNWVNSLLQREESGRFAEGLPEVTGLSSACGMANTTSIGNHQRNNGADERGWPGETEQNRLGSSAGRMGNANLEGLERLIGNDSAAGWQGAIGSASTPGVHSRPLEVNGFWRDADWLFCRDGQWRPVEPGTFPLVARFAKSLGHGKSSLRAMAGRNRTGRLKGYGNAINAQAAAEFIRAYMGVSYGR